MYCIHQTCPLWETKACTCSEPGECDLAQFFPKEIKSKGTYAPLYVRFTYKDEWRHIGTEETFALWNATDLGLAIYAFRERHKSNGALMIFVTHDLVDWMVWGEEPAGEPLEKAI